MNAFTLFLGLKDRDGTDIAASFGIDNIERAIVTQLASYSVHGFTLTPATGYWKGVREEVIQIYLSGVEWTDAQAIAADLAHIFSQECVGVRPEQSLLFVEPRFSK